MGYHERLREFFKEKNIKQKDVGNALGYKQAMIQRYLSTQGPNFEFLTRLVESYPDIDLNYLFKGIRNESSNSENNLLVVSENDTPEYGAPIGIIEEIEEKLNELKNRLSQK